MLVPVWSGPPALGGWLVGLAVLDRAPPTPSPTFVRMGGTSCSFSQRRGLAASPWAPCLPAGLLSCSLCTVPVAGKSASTPHHQMGVGLRPGFCDCKQSCPQLSCLGVCVDKWFYFS